MELTELLSQWTQTIGANLKNHVQGMQIVRELNKNAQNYFGKEKMTEVRPSLLDQLVMIGPPIHALIRISFQLRILITKTPISLVFTIS